MSDPQRKIILSKVDAVERQLDTAIWLWFNEGDVVSIIQLTGAALGILDDLLFHKLKERPVAFREDILRKAGVTARQARPFITSQQDFAKHARNDPEASQEYEWEFASYYIYMAIMAYTRLTDTADDVGGLMRIFTLWFGIHTIKDFDEPGAESFKRTFQGFNFDRLHKLSRIEFFQETGDAFIGRPPSGG